MMIPALAVIQGVTSPAGVPLALAFGAGVLSTLNPCGFALLPAYVSYTVGQRTGGRQESGWEHILRGGLLGLPLTGGFLLVFLVAGGILALGGRALAHLFPWLALLVGLALVILGGWMILTGRSLEMPGVGVVVTRLNTLQRGAASGAGALSRAQTPTHELRAAWSFGLGYGLSSLGCTLPVFLLVVGTAVTASGTASAVLVLATYAAGMILVLLPVALFATTLSDLFSQFVFPRLGWVQPLAALLLIAAGLYIVVFQLRAGLW